MTGRIIFENEIKSCQDAAGKLFENEGDPRTNYQKIFHTLEGCKDRFVEVPSDEKGEYLRAVSIIARYVVNGAVKIPPPHREKYLELAKSEVKRGILAEIREEFSKR